MKYFVILSIALLCCACGSKKITETITEDDIVKAPAQPLIPGKIAMPRACIYKTNGNFNNNVTVGYDRANNTFISFPAPTDVNSDAEPLQLINGWLLSRRGNVNENTAFLKWTYSEYHGFDATPSIPELKEALIPDAFVTEFKLLDMTTSSAQADTAAVNEIIRELGI